MSQEWDLYVFDCLKFNLTSARSLLTKLCS